jgi:hypothetical protein
MRLQSIRRVRRHAPNLTSFAALVRMPGLPGRSCPHQVTLWSRKFLIQSDAAGRQRQMDSVLTADASCAELTIHLIPSNAAAVLLSASPSGQSSRELIPLGA